MAFDRITKSKEYQKIYREGIKLQNQNYCVYILINHLNTKKWRLGITVSKKINKAHDRNRVKRLIREWFRSFIKNKKEDLYPGMDVVVIAKPESVKLNFWEVKKNLDDLLASFYTTSDYQTL